MRITVRPLGVKQAKEKLEAIGRKIEPVVRGTLNTTATQARNRRFIKPMAPLFKSSLLGRALANADIRGKIALKRAGGKRLNARLIPSSSSVYVDDYRAWNFEAINSTRGRIFVRGLRGRKVAAGFVNPSSAKQKPLSTRSERARKLAPNSKAKNKHIKSYRYGNGGSLSPAMGPSVAYWFKQLATTQTVAWVNEFLQAEFERRLTKEIAKGAK